jgi:hypothetical protein
MSSDVWISFSCPAFGFNLKSPVKYAGRGANCINCKAPVAVPAARTWQHASPQPRGEVAKPRPSFLRRILWASGLVLGVAGQIHDLMEFKTINTFVKSMVPAVSISEPNTRETPPLAPSQDTRHLTVEEFMAQQAEEEHLAEKATRGRRMADEGTDAWWVSSLKVIALFWTGIIVLFANALMGVSLVARPVTGLDAWPWMTASGTWYCNTAVQNWFWKASNPIGTVVGVMGVALMLSLMHLFDGKNRTSRG